ncbi:MAG: Maf family protein [Acidobacteriaceae bacterium]
MANRTDNATHLYLASNSPRRRELLALCGLEFHTLNAQVDETPLPGEGGVKYVQRLAKTKAETASRQVGTHCLVIAADTTVVDADVAGRPAILGKPASPGEAIKMLCGLRGHSHQVHTAISLHPGQEGNVVSDLCTTLVPMRDYSDQEIDAYVATRDPMDKAGAYAIQHAGFHPVEKLAGCYANVMGLPLCHLTRNLIKMGLPPPADVPTECQHALAYLCPVYTQILEGIAPDYT